MATIEIKVPVLPESVSDATITTWHKKPGDFIKRDENLVDIETDKVVLEVVAPHEGTLISILKPIGTTVVAEEIIGLLQPNNAPSKKKKSSPSMTPVETPSLEAKRVVAPTSTSSKLENLGSLSPTARRLAKEKTPDTAEPQQNHPEQVSNNDPVLHQSTHPVISEDDSYVESRAISQENMPNTPHDRTESRVPMTRLRIRIAERLIEAQQTSAILTTFNEVNMQPIIIVREKHKERFEKMHGVRLGFMSFFTIAVVTALQRFPIINASIDGQDIVYHHYYDIGIAISSSRGLVVPILRNAEHLTMPAIEKQISDFSKKAHANQLNLQDIRGGTFTISNGGVFGSLMSTPILNPPQSGVLGMHKIQERVVVENGQMVICPMMYVALSYDHRIVDGQDSVQFLATVKALLEDPVRLILSV